MKPNLPAIRARAEKATKGPWKAELDEETWGSARGAVRGPNGLDYIALLSAICPETEGDPLDWRDAIFIAHSRTDIPDLLAYVEELEKTLKFSISITKTREDSRLEKENRELLEALEDMWNQFSLPARKINFMKSYNPPDDYKGRWAGGLSALEECQRLLEKHKDPGK